MFVVIDTNVLVSALWSPNGAPAQVLSLMLNGVVTPCFDYRIMIEYDEVLRRPKFQFNRWTVRALLEYIKSEGLSVVAKPLDVPFIDEDDKKFFEVAKQCEAKLITGNLKHFPRDPCILTVSDFLNLKKE